MGYAYFHIRHQTGQDFRDCRKFLHFVVKEEDLATAVEFVVDDALDFFFVEEYYFCLDGDAVWRRGVDDAQILNFKGTKSQGTVPPSGSGVLCAVPACICSGAPHVG